MFMNKHCFDYFVVEIYRLQCYYYKFTDVPFFSLCECAYYYNNVRYKIKFCLIKELFFFFFEKYNSCSILISSYINYY